MVGRGGVEPTTNALKGRCSTIELSTPNQEGYDYPKSTRLRQVKSETNLEHYFELNLDGFLARIAVNSPSHARRLKKLKRRPNLSRESAALMDCIVGKSNVNDAE